MSNNENTETNRSAFSDGNTIRNATGELADYRPVSRLAIVALFIGFASFLAIFHNLLWFVPIFGVAVAVAAIRQTGRPDTIFTGHRLALAALGLSVLFGALAVTKSYVERQLVARQAAEVATGWINIVRSGNVPQAVNWMQSPGRRPDDNTDLANFYTITEDGESLLAEFADKKAVKQLNAIDKNATVKLAGLESYVRDGSTYLYYFRFELPDTEGEASTPLICGVRRTFNHEQIRWTVSNLEPLINK